MLFRSIFRQKNTGPYTKSLVEDATERALEDTDPCLRGVSGYRKKLKPAVVKSLEHVTALVESLGEPLQMDGVGFSRDFRLKLLFPSAENMSRVLRDDPNVKRLSAAKTAATGSIHALLLMDYEEKPTFGTESQGNIVTSNVPQVAANFRNHRLLDVTRDAQETLCLLRRRAYDQLLQIALNLITRQRDKRAGLERRHTLLQSKARVLERAKGGFVAATLSPPVNTADLGREINEIRNELAKLGCETKADQKHFNLLVEVLGTPQKHLWSDPLHLIVDSLGIKRNPGDADAKELTFTRISTSQGKNAVACLVRIPSE
ncbi:hypothetical protein [Geoalkalibacter halelectricus]|uniref:hypothetical protein n=1 Tax=Geoalkalibacter halelectricus TaxID=2847045 RepID=UPI003D21C44B